MNNTNEKCPHSTPVKYRPTVRNLIVYGLGYCCEWFFFQHVKQTGMIALRLGVSKRQVQKAKARVRDGESTCTGCPTCMKNRIG